MVRCSMSIGFPLNQLILQVPNYVIENYQHTLYIVATLSLSLSLSIYI